MKSTLSAPGFLWLLLTAICITVILYGLKKALGETNWTKTKCRNIFSVAVIVIACWITLLVILAYNGFFADFSKLPPRPVFAIFFPLPFILLLAFSKTGKELLRVIPQHWLVLFQSFRIAVEILILLAFLANKLPVQMTFEGRNFDMLTGILALPVGYLIIKRKSLSPKLVIWFNVMGILLLLNVLTVALLSMPVSFRYFTNEPSVGLVAQFPFILLPGVLVPIAYSFHIFSLRQLYIKKQDNRIFV